MRTYNPTTLAFMTHFHRERDSYDRVVSSDKEAFKKALFNVVTNRTSGRPGPTFRFARYCGKEYCYFPDPTEEGIQQYSDFLTKNGYIYNDIKSNQFDLSGFPPDVDTTIYNNMCNS